MTIDLRGRRAARPQLVLERAARRPVTDLSRSRMVPHAARGRGLSAALAVGFISPGGRAIAVPSYLCRAADRMPAHPGRTGHARHRGHSPRGALDHLLQADRARAGVGRRAVRPLVPAGAMGVPGRTGERDHRRYPGAAMRQDRTGHQHPALPEQQGQPPDLFAQPVSRHAGAGGARPAGLGADGNDSLLAGRGVRTTWQALGGAAVDRLGPGECRGRAFADRCLVHAPESDFALGRTAGADHWPGAPGCHPVLHARAGAAAP